jgi:aminoglycoside N3'-acetyltransferase
MHRRAVGRRKLVRQLEALGIRNGAVLVVHTSFKAIAPIAGGPRGLIDGLLSAVGAAGTVVMPSLGDWDDSEVFDPTRTPCRGLGIVADTFWRMPGVRRSDSPHSFAAFGPRAEEITSPHPPDLPHGPDSPVGRVHEMDGLVLLLGVDHDANTMVHLGEHFANVPYRIPKFCTVRRGGAAIRVDYGEIDHCCRNFRLVGGWLDRRGLERRGQVGHGIACLARARDVVSTVVTELEADTCRFLCPAGTGCEECDAARASIP